MEKILMYLDRKLNGAKNFYTFDGNYYTDILKGSVAFDFWYGRLIEYNDIIYFLHSVEYIYDCEYFWKVRLYGINMTKTKKFYDLMDTHNAFSRRQKTHRLLEQERLWSLICK